MSQSSTDHVELREAEKLSWDHEVSDEESVNSVELSNFLDTTDANKPGICNFQSAVKNFITARKDGPTGSYGLIPVSIRIDQSLIDNLEVHPRTYLKEFFLEQAGVSLVGYWVKDVTKDRKMTWVQLDGADTLSSLFKKHSMFVVSFQSQPPETHTTQQAYLKFITNGGLKMKPFEGDVPAELDRKLDIIRKPNNSTIETIQGQDEPVFVFNPKRPRMVPVSRFISSPDFPERPTLQLSGFQRDLTALERSLFEEFFNVYLNMPSGLKNRQDFVSKIVAAAASLTPSTCAHLTVRVPLTNGVKIDNVCALCALGMAQETSYCEFEMDDLVPIPTANCTVKVSTNLDGPIGQRSTVEEMAKRVAAVTPRFYMYPTVTDNHGTCTTIVVGMKNVGEHDDSSNDLTTMTQLFLTYNQFEGDFTDMGSFDKVGDTLHATLTGFTFMFRHTNGTKFEFIFSERGFDIIARSFQRSAGFSYIRHGFWYLPFRIISRAWARGQHAKLESLLLGCAVANHLWSKTATEAQLSRAKAKQVKIMAETGYRNDQLAPTHGRVVIKPNQTADRYVELTANNKLLAKFMSSVIGDWDLMKRNIITIQSDIFGIQLNQSEASTPLPVWLVTNKQDWVTGLTTGPLFLVSLKPDVPSTKNFQEYFPDANKFDVKITEADRISFGETLRDFQAPVKESPNSRFSRPRPKTTLDRKKRSEIISEALKISKSPFSTPELPSKVTIGDMIQTEAIASKQTRDETKAIKSENTWKKRDGRSTRSETRDRAETEDENETRRREIFVRESNLRELKKEKPDDIEDETFESFVGIKGKLKKDYRPQQKAESRSSKYRVGKESSTESESDKESTETVEKRQPWRDRVRSGRSEVSVHESDITRVTHPQTVSSASRRQMVLKKPK